MASVPVAVAAISPVAVPAAITVPAAIAAPMTAAAPAMVNLGLSRVDDAVASKHPVRRPAWTRAPTSEADLSGAGALVGVPSSGKRRGTEVWDPLAVAVEASCLGGQGGRRGVAGPPGPHDEWSPPPGPECALGRDRGGRDLSLPPLPPHIIVSQLLWVKSQGM
mgnify:CR=1 FL=1